MLAANRQWFIKATKNNFPRLIWKTITWVLRGLSQLVKVLSGMNRLVWIIKPHFWLFILDGNGWWKPVIRNCAVAKDASTLVFATTEMQTFSDKVSKKFWL